MVYYIKLNSNKYQRTVIFQNLILFQSKIILDSLNYNSFLHILQHKGGSISENTSLQQYDPAKDDTENDIGIKISFSIDIH